MNVGRCNAGDCQARILWVQTINGGTAPIDVEPVPPPPEGKGNIVLVKRTEAEAPMALVIAGKLDDDVIAKMADNGAAFYTDHHATCTNPDDFRDTPL